MTLADAIESRGCSCSSESGWHYPWCPVQIAADLRSGRLGQDVEPRAEISVLAEKPNTEQWAMIAMKGQFVVRMTPKHFPFMDTFEETVERARLYPKMNPEFEVRWKGYHLLGVRIDGAVEI